MKNEIQINLGTDHALECTEKIIGRSGEGLVSTLAITVPEALTDYDAYIDFEKPNGEVLRTPKLEVRYGVVYYDVPQYLLFESGEIKVQLVFIKGKNVWKSSKKRYTILKSINASDDIPDKEDFISQAQAVLDELSGEVQEIADMLADNADFAQSVIDACGGQTKIITINGKPLRFFVDTQEEYDKLSETQKQNLFAIITDDTAKERMEGRLNVIENGFGLIRNGELSVGLAEKARFDINNRELRADKFLNVPDYPTMKEDGTELFFPLGTMFAVMTGATLKMYQNITDLCFNTNNGDWQIVYGVGEPDDESVVAVGGSWLVIGKCGSETVKVLETDVTFNYYLIVKVGD